jgi:hypothetical protein
MTPPILIRLLLDEGDIVDNDKVDDMNRQVTVTRAHAGVRGGGGLVAVEDCERNKDEEVMVRRFCSK